MKYNFILLSLKELYSKPYDGKMEMWRNLGAIDKARNIHCLLNGSNEPPGKILDVGCGTGAVLKELARNNVGEKLFGIEIGSERSKQNSEIVNGREIIINGYDGITIPFDDNTFDIVYATHVLEHVVDERKFLQEMSRVSKKLVFLEVPLEINIRTNFKLIQRTLNIGHINSYCLQSFILRLETCGLKTISFDVFDQSYNSYRFQYSYLKAAINASIRKVSLHALGGQMASKIFTYHASALCEKGEKLDIC